MSGVGAYCLVKYLVHDRRAAFISAIGFAFCPYLFGHLAQIQLLMTAGLPFTLFAFHRLADNPSAARGLALGLVMAAQAVLCGYYGIFAVLIVAFSISFVIVAEGRWFDRHFWAAIATAVVVAVVAIAPVTWPYVLHQRETGFERPLAEARHYSARWQMFVASNSYAHSWMVRLIDRPGELLFPGFVPLLFGLRSVVSIGSSRRSRPVALMYTLMAGLALWMSLGPRAGLYRLMYAIVPGFSFIRAPSRFGVILALALCVLAGHGAAALFGRVQQHRLRTVAVLAVLILAVLDVVTPLRLRAAPPVPAAYQKLATLPRGPLLELPVYSDRFQFLRARYNLLSTHHWMPIVVAYSDYVPREFTANMHVLAEFPTRAAFKRLERNGVRYVMVHLAEYSQHQRRELQARLDAFSSYLRPWHADDAMLLYEIATFPP
jgi:hypothetical protein